MKAAHTFCMGMGCESPKAGWTCKVCQTRGRGLLAKVDAVAQKQPQAETDSGGDVTEDHVNIAASQSVARAVKERRPACHMCKTAEASVGHPQFLHEICQPCHDLLEPGTWDCQSKWRLMNVSSPNRYARRVYTRTLTDDTCETGVPTK